MGIDPQSRHYILNVIKKINQSEGTTIIYTSHYMDEIEYLCDDIAILDHGKIMLHQSKEELMKNDHIATLHLSDESQKEINLYENYDALVEVFCEIKEKSLHVKELSLPKNSLENLFLSLTKKELRD